jgi:hypothetical protein
MQDTRPCVAAARRWLEANFSAEHNPGRFGEEREVLRDATYYYYCWSAAHAFMALDLREIKTSHGTMKWAEALAAELMRRQRPDGSWRNRFTDAKEDDALVSTPWAAATLALCRASITGNSETLFPRPSKVLPARNRSSFLLLFEGRVWKDKGSKYWRVEAPLLDIITQGTSKNSACALIADAFDGLINQKGFRIRGRSANEYSNASL